VVEPAELCDTAQIVGWVGSEVVLASDLIVGIDALLEAAYRDKLSPEQLKAQQTKYRAEVIRGIRELVTGVLDGNDLTQGQKERKIIITQLLKRQIQTKLVCHDARREIPEEGFSEVEKNFGKHFEKQMLPKMMEEAGVETRQELDQKLRGEGISLQRVKRAFIQQALAQTWVREKLNLNQEVTYDEMVAYYRDHLSEYEHPARARWEELMVRISKFPNEAAAYAEIARMGNQVWNNVPFSQVAKASSHGATADEGGLRDWTTQGNLVSGVLDRSVFGLPVGQLSPILRTEDGYHIVRVIEREEAGRTPFLEAQVEIRSKIQHERFNGEYAAYIDRLHRDIPVRTASNLPVQPETTTRR
jgi:parvulin-like peptidyl-prolyl isomerase